MAKKKKKKVILEYVVIIKWLQTWMSWTQSSDYSKSRQPFPYSKYFFCLDNAKHIKLHIIN